MSGTHIAAIRLLCRDIEATLAFYESAFGCRNAGEKDGIRALLLGTQRLEFAAAMLEPEVPPPSNATGFQHCAIIVSDMGEAMQRLGAVSGWSPITTGGPQRLRAASGGATAFKFRDPEGHPLEFLQFPEDQVPEPWTSMAGGPCLGIDHSAITVRDVDRSIAFYEEQGFRLAGRQMNRGSEQGCLDGLGADASVEVVTLMPQGGAPPHLELLCYQNPAAFAAPVSDGSVFATLLLLESEGQREVVSSDPDGHRLSSRIRDAQS